MLIWKHFQSHHLIAKIVAILNNLIGRDSGSVVGKWWEANEFIMGRLHHQAETSGATMDCFSVNGCHFKKFYSTHMHARFASCDAFNKTNLAFICIIWLNKNYQSAFLFPLYLLLIWVEFKLSTTCNLILTERKVAIF